MTQKIKEFVDTWTMFDNRDSKTTKNYLRAMRTDLDSLITSAVEEERERIMKSINPQYKPKP